MMILFVMSTWLMMNELSSIVTSVKSDRCEFTKNAAPPYASRVKPLLSVSFV